MDEPDDDLIEVSRPEGLFGSVERPVGERPRTGEVACPRCGSTIDPVPVVYGYPTPETFAEAEAGRVRLGGCVIEPEAPDFRCPICDAALPMVAESWRQ